MLIDKKDKAKHPILSKIVLKENEVIIPGKRVIMEKTKSQHTAINSYYKQICKY